MYELIIHDDATNDLKALLKVNRPCALKLAALLNQLKSDQDLLDRLTQDSYGGSPKNPRPKNASFNTSKWYAAQNDGMNLWRMRPFQVEILGHRFIYAFFPPATYIVLGIVEKAQYDDSTDERFNYELSHPTSKRISDAYRRLEDEHC